MPLTKLDFRLRIRNAADTADLLLLSTLATANPYVLVAPTGDGQDFDTVTGKTSVGVYSLTAIDAPVVAGGRVVSNVMADASLRYQLIGKKAFIERSLDGGATWLVFVAGYLTRLRKVSALVFEFQVGDTMRVDTNLPIFDTQTAYFDAMSCICGGPVKGGFGPIRDYGGYIMECVGRFNGAGHPGFVRFKYVKGFQRRSTDNLWLNFPTGGYEYVEGGITAYEDKRVNDLARPFNVYDATFVPGEIGTTFPRLQARVEDMNGTLMGLFTPVGWFPDASKKQLIDNSKMQFWWGTGTNPATGAAWEAQPALNQQVRVIVYPLDINADNPLHVSGHPVDIEVKLFQQTGIAYNAASAAAVKLEIGATIGVALRITGPSTLDKFQQLLRGLYGYSTRINSAGEREFFQTRIVNATPPTVQLGTDVIRDPKTVVFDVDEKSIINKLQVKHLRFDLWSPDHYGKDAARPIDEIVVTPLVTNVENGELLEYQEHTQVFDLPGELVVLDTGTNSLLKLIGGLFVNGFGGIGSHTPNTPADTFIIGVAKQFFNRRERGAIKGTLRVLDTAVTRPVQIGDEFYVDTTVGWWPNANDVPGGNRIVQVTKRTENTTGPELECEDSGTDNQPAHAPAYTVAKDDATDPLRYAIIEFSNSATLAAEGDSVRVQMSLDGGVSYHDLTYFTAADLVTPFQIRTPSLISGAHLYVRCRSERPLIRPSAWVLHDCVLDGLVAPTAIAWTPDALDDSAGTISWTPGDLTAPVELELKRTSDAAWHLSGVGPAGSTQLRIGGLLLGTSYDARIRCHSIAPRQDVSAYDGPLTFTTGATARQLQAPDNPSPFSGSYNPSTGALINDGTFGLEVTAREVPSFVQFEVALETAPGSGIFGAYDDTFRLSLVAAVNFPGRTRFSAVAANDGCLRKLRAKSILTGCLDSAYCDETEVLPWTPLVPTDFPVPVPDQTLAYQVVNEAGSQRAIIVDSWSQPLESQYADMEYLVRARPVGGTYGSYARVPGTKQGPDTISAIFGLEFEVTNVTVTTQGVRNIGSPVTITIPAAAADGLVTSTADVDSMNVVVTPDVVTAAYDVFSQTYASDPGAVDTVQSPANYIGPRRPASLTYFELPVDAGANNWRVVTLVFYDQNGIEGAYETTIAQQDPGASPPTAPTLANHVNAALGVVERATFVTAPTAGDQMAFYRGGVLLSTGTISSTDVTNGYIDLTDTTAASGATYDYTVKQHRLSDGLISAVSNIDTITVAAGGALTAPGAPSTAVDPGDPCASFLVTPRDSSSNPTGTVYDIYTATTSGGSYTLSVSGAALNNAVSVSRPSGQHGTSWCKCKARKSGFTTSGFGANASIGPTPSGLPC